MGIDQNQALKASCVRYLFFLIYFYFYFIIIFLYLHFKVFLCSLGVLFVCLESMLSCLGLIGVGMQCFWIDLHT